jgi:hypothetical protein
MRLDRITEILGIARLTGLSFTHIAAWTARFGRQGRSQKGSVTTVGGRHRGAALVRALLAISPDCRLLQAMLDTAPR